MRVYRIEHRASGHGPYAGWQRMTEQEREAFYCTCSYEDHDDDCRYWEAIEFHGHVMWNSDFSTQPAPMDDGINHREWYCYGFESLDALGRWFDSMLNDLDDLGYVLTEYEAYGRVQVGRSGQVAFDRRDSVRIA